MTDVVASGAADESVQTPPAAEERTRRLPMGILLIPFVIGTVLIVAIGWALERRVTIPWLVLGFLVGAIGSVSAVVSILRRRASPERRRAAGARGEGDRKDRHSDPLGHIQAGEAEHRRYRRPCMNCGAKVPVSLAECPACGHAQVHPCKKCGTTIRPEWDHCPECGTSFHP